MTGDNSNDLGSRTKMGDDGIPDDGPCLFMSYLDVAQTYAKKKLTDKKVKKLIEDDSLYTKESWCWLWQRCY